MNNAQILSTVRHVIEVETNQSLADIDPDRDIRAQISFDSMQYVAISVAIENALGVELPIEVMKARTFNDFMHLVYAEVARRGSLSAVDG